MGKDRLGHSKKRHRLVVVNFSILLHVIEKLRQTFISLQQVCQNQARCFLWFADLLQLVEATCSKPVDSTSWQVTFKTSVDNLQQMSKVASRRRNPACTVVLLIPPDPFFLSAVSRSTFILRSANWNVMIPFVWLTSNYAWLCLMRLTISALQIFNSFSKFQT